jgi:hypothetical protein
MILGEIKGQREKKEQESRGPEEDHAAFEQLNIFIVVTLHIHGGTPVLQNENQQEKIQSHFETF